MELLSVGAMISYVCIVSTLVAFLILLRKPFMILLLTACAALAFGFISSNTRLSRIGTIWGLFLILIAIFTVILVVQKRVRKRKTVLSEDGRPFVQMHARIVSMRCTPDGGAAEQKCCYIMFLSDDGGRMEYLVDEKAYLLFEEGQTGTLYTVEDTFGGFVKDQK